MVLRKPDFIAGSALLLTGSFFGWLAWRDFPGGSGNVPGPAFFPIVLCFLLAVAGVCLIVEAAGGKGVPEICFSGYSRLGKVLMLLVLYVGIFAWIGFCLSTVFFLAAMMVAMNVRSPMQILLFSFPVMLLIWGFFRFYLGVPLP